jgi:hypothetical protein
MSVCVSVYLCVCLSVCLSVCVSVCLCVCVSVSKRQRWKPKWLWSNNLGLKTPGTQRSSAHRTGSAPQKTHRRDFSRSLMRASLSLRRCSFSRRALLRSSACFMCAASSALMVLPDVISAALACSSSIFSLAACREHVVHQCIGGKEKGDG